jgi:citrate lyase subunit beta/citryl-CoA lyase
MSHQAQAERARSFLFVPGSRPDRFAKAESSGADVVVFDLEDAVPTAEKTGARSAVVGYLQRRGAIARKTAAMVRINSPHTPIGKADLAALAALHAPYGVVVSKADSASVALTAAALGSDAVVLPLVESARGLQEVETMARQDCVVRLLFGHLDFCAEVGIDPRDSDALRPVRLAIRVASAAAVIAPPVDGVTAQFEDDGQLQEDMRDAVRLGFGGKLCIHPRQIQTVHAAMHPSADEVSWARSVLAHAADDGASALNGEMIDPPVTLRANAVLSRTGEFHDISD